MVEPGTWSGWAPLVIFMGAGAGALLRWGLGAWFNDASPGFPWGTLLANLIGGFLIGVALHLLSAAALTDWDPEHIRLIRLMLVTGFLGGLTTFSTFSAEVVDLMGQHRWSAACAWASVHLLGSLALTAIGWGLAKTVTAAGVS